MAIPAKRNAASAGGGTPSRRACTSIRPVSAAWRTSGARPPSYGGPEPPTGPGHPSHRRTPDLCRSRTPLVTPLQQPVRCRSPHRLDDHQGYHAADLPSERTMRDILNRMGYRLKRIQKGKPLKKTEETDAIFANVAAVRAGGAGRSGDAGDLRSIPRRRWRWAITSGGEKPGRTGRGRWRRAGTTTRRRRRSWCRWGCWCC